nr:protein-glucosylgalactosylhydroxylysine glucosidase-like [Lytechinus pictus]
MRIKVCEMANGYPVMFYVFCMTCVSVVKSACLCSDYPDISPEAYIFETPNLPQEACCMPTIGNGYLATTVYGNFIHVNGIYNGRYGDSHHTEVPSMADIHIESNGKEFFTESFMLNVIKGIFYHKITLKAGNIEHRIYAHQHTTRLIVNEILISRKQESTEEITVSLTHKFNPKSDDVRLQVVAPKTEGDPWFSSGSTITSETPTSSTSQLYMYWDDVPRTLTLASGADSQVWTFLFAISGRKSEALLSLIAGWELRDAGMLCQMHEHAWQQKWKDGKIDLDGTNLELAKAIYGSMYYITSSLPPQGNDVQFPFHFYGISPGDLAHGGRDPDGYKGHVFWDQETWMFPPILMFHPDIASEMLKSRSHHLQAAKDNAAKNGYRGAQYPWEMAFTGVEVCPATPYPTNELHISGDIAFAVQQHLWATNDTTFLEDHDGFEMIKSIAEFWENKVEYNQTLEAYTISNVMPPDEYHESVNNSVFTNSIAQISLRLPAYAASLINKSVPAEWAVIADNMFIPFDHKLQYHPEFEGYTPGTIVKQADAILLGYPLMANMTAATRRNDLEIYETYEGANVTDPDGPAMTWGMFAIGWFEMKNLSKAEKFIARSYANIQEPFKIWTETATGAGAVNFVTGMGGFLQAIVFGYGGIRLQRNSLLVDITLPANTDTITFRGLNYLGNSLCICGKNDTVHVTVLDRNNLSFHADLQLVQGSHVIPLYLKTTVTVPRFTFSIEPAH